MDARLAVLVARLRHQGQTTRLLEVKVPVDHVYVAGGLADDDVFIRDDFKIIGFHCHLFHDFLLFCRVCYQCLPLELLNSLANDRTRLVE